MAHELAKEDALAASTGASLSRHRRRRRMHLPHAGIPLGRQSLFLVSRPRLAPVYAQVSGMLLVDNHSS